jgi:hypothetical protein
MEGGCVTRAVIEQKMVLGRSDSADTVEPLEEGECGGLGAYRISIASPEIYDEILEEISREVG